MNRVPKWSSTKWFIFLGVVLSAGFTTFAQQPEAPVIVRHPLSTTLSVGDSATFSVTARGTAPLTCQWVTDTGAITGATDSVLSFGPLTLGDNGRTFHCIVENDEGKITSRNALLNVKRPTSETIVVTGELYGKHSGYAVGYDGGKEMDFTVRLYPTLESDSAVYTEHFMSDEGRGVTVNDGKFAIRLGEGVSQTGLQEVIRQYPSLYAAFSVGRPGGNPETLEPRTPLTSAPYALAGRPEVIKGNVHPDRAGIEAPIGTYYVWTGKNRTFVKTAKKWVKE